MTSCGMRARLLLFSFQASAFQHALRTTKRDTFSL
jgi:hypothetical protein